MCLLKRYGWHFEQPFLDEKLNPQATNRERAHWVVGHHLNRLHRLVSRALLGRRGKQPHIVRALSGLEERVKPPEYRRRAHGSLLGTYDEEELLPRGDAGHQAMEMVELLAGSLTTQPRRSSQLGEREMRKTKGLAVLDKSQGRPGRSRWGWGFGQGM